MELTKKKHIANKKLVFDHYCQFFLVTADYGMNYKNRCWDLAKACANRGLHLKYAVSPVADRLLKHHRGFGGVSNVYLKHPGKAESATQMIRSLDGVEEVLYFNPAGEHPDPSQINCNLDLTRVLFQSTDGSNGLLTKK